jgi:hypothetical protein
MDPRQVIDGSIQKYPMGFFCQTVPGSGGEEKLGEGIPVCIYINSSPIWLYILRWQASTGDAASFST